MTGTGRSAGSGDREDPPPFWGRWGRIYLLVAGLLAVETAAFWWLARWAS